MSRLTSIDTETTGVDRHHGARPYFVTGCDEKGNVTYWEWRINPLNREPIIPPGDIREVQDYIDSFDTLVLQNSKFDISMLALMGITILWEKVQDTLVAGHLLASALPHNLTDMVMQYLNEDIEPFEKDVHKATEECRRRCRSIHKDWMIAKQGLPCMPSAKKECWKYDMWLPRELALSDPEEYPKPYNWCDHIDSKTGKSTWGADWICTKCKGHKYHVILRDYANTDSDYTRRLWPVMEEELHRRGLWEVYQVRMKCLPVAYRMEQRGVSVSVKELEKLKAEYITESEKCSTVCDSIAEDYGYSLTLPKSGNNKSLSTFIFDKLNLPVLDTTENDNPCLDADVLEEYELTQPRTSPAHVFIKSLRSKRKVDKATEALQGYEAFWLDMDACEYKKLYPNANMTGTVTLRWGFNNPNTANISKQGEYNLRRAFGPAPGREWYSLDAQNIELRIPAYEAGEQELIDVFDRPNDPPYYGSYHLAIFDTLHPKLFAQHGKNCKVLFESTWYQWVKNGNFARQYNAGKKKADLTYRVEGASDKIENRFPKIKKLGDRMIAYANKTGYVLTIPDRESHPKTGYPLMCKRDDFSKIVPTTPLCYHVSGTAMQWMNSCMVRTDRRLREWRDEGFEAYMILQVHDELVFDFPRVSNRGNKSKVLELKGIMESVGDTIGIPTPVSVDFHPISWAVAEEL